MPGDRVRTPADWPAGVDGEVASHPPGALPAEAGPVDQNWETLRPSLRERLSGALGTILMWWRDDNDPFLTGVSAFGERGMCRAEPATRDGVAGHRLDLRLWAPGSVKSQEFRGPGPAPDRTAGDRMPRDRAVGGDRVPHDRTGPGRTPSLTLPPEVSALLGHMPAKAQRYLQVPLLAGGGEANGMRWYQIWNSPDEAMDAWLWLRAGRAVTFAHGRRERRGGGSGGTAHWELRCWRATCT
ncbi:hypothetical protein [Virgisporangium aurantiacum]|uniref:Uncharacterized protein n=1 Tax=Virgisporangium aurantiacum TaxID=175570 RepID=A0A8J3ZIG1_9ACTN|nr:hypothetical protein [Virgisporangium aurantiacum]GIJ63547.1 hypothetical protein Vau01_110630 [Virgisporangium aurantiacum]